jgi:hypothetical protein
VVEASELLSGWSGSSEQVAALRCVAREMAAQLLETHDLAWAGAGQEVLQGQLNSVVDKYVELRSEMDNMMTVSRAVSCVLGTKALCLLLVLRASEGCGWCAGPCHCRAVGVVGAVLGLVDGTLLTLCAAGRCVAPCWVLAGRMRALQGGNLLVMPVCVCWLVPVSLSGGSSC